MAKRAQSSQPTVSERLSKTPALQPAVRSQSMYGYDEAKPGFVAYDRNAGHDNSLMGLARALSGLDTALRPIIERRLDKQIEEGVARGETTFAENPDDNKNRNNFKDFIEANPEFTNDNPYLQIGYEKARLRALGLDYKKALHDAAAQNNIYNEKDLNVVRKFTDDFTADFRKTHQLDKYEDKITLAQNFTAVEAQAKAGFYAAHSNNLREQNEKLAIQQFTDLAVKEAESLTDLTAGGIDLDDPVQAEEGGGKKSLLGIIAKNLSEATAHGVQNANAPAMALSMLTTLYKKNGSNPRYLEAAKQIEINGTKLINHPGVAEKIEGLERERINRQRADWQYAKAVEAYREKQEDKVVESKIYQYSLTGAPFTPDTIVQLGIPDRLKPKAEALLGGIYTARHKMLQASPAMRKEAGQALVQAKTGQLDMDHALYFFSETGDEDILKSAIEAQKEENRTLTENLKTGAKEVFGTFAKLKGDMEWEMMKKLDDNAYQRDVNAANDFQMVFLTRYEDAYKKLVREKNVKSLNSAEAVALRIQVQGEVIGESMKIRTEQRKAEAEQDAAQAKAEKEQKPGKALDPGRWMVQPSAVPLARSSHPQPQTRLDPAAIEWVTGSFPSLRGKVDGQTDPEMVRQFLQRHFPNKLPEFENTIKQGGVAQ